MASKRDTLAATLAKTVAGVDEEKIKQLMETVTERQQDGQNATLVDVMAEEGVVSDDQAKQIREQVEAKLKSRIGDFEILKKLGEGGMGAVYRARQISMDRTVALKLLSKPLAKNRTFVERFIREARASAKLEHPNVIRGYAVGEADGLYFFAMEFVDGESVQDKLDRDGPLEVGEAVRIVADVTRALAHAQTLNMVHRDIKPDNIMVTRDGVVKLADLGLAKQLDDDSSITKTGAGFGTPYYMPPEQAVNAKHVDGRSDIYALGATLYCMLTGVVPFTGDTPMEVLTAKEKGTFKPARRLNENVSERLDLVIDKMMAKDPQHRYQTCQELLGDLQSTGLVPASDRAAPAVPTAGATPARKAPAAAATAPPGKDADKPAPKGIWWVRFKDASGKPAKTKADVEGVRRMIRDGTIGLGARASRNPKTDFRPLQAIREFQDLMSARVIKAKSDKKTGGEGSMAARYAEMEREYQHKKFMKKLRTWIGRLIIAIVLIGGALIAYKVYTDKSSGSGDAGPAEKRNTQ